jgi:hypothetical protein
MNRNRLNYLQGLIALLACTAGGSLQAITPTPNYYGGPVLSNAQVVMVNWGSGVPALVQSSMPMFYTDVMRSDYFGILEEYSTNILASDGLAGSNQQIRFGSFLESDTIAPAHCGSAGVTCTLTEAQLQTELSDQITAGHLPAPALDANGHPNTVYMVHFDPKVTITLTGSGSASCAIYCAAESKFTYGALTLPVGIIPDQTSASACYPGCGGATSLQAETLTSMEELVNAVTNADPDFSTIGRPLAWLDPINGLVGDLCRGSSVQVTANGNPYTVWKIWSKKSQQCNFIGYLFRSSFD